LQSQQFESAREAEQATEANDTLGDGPPGSFVFLGFMHSCGHSRAGKFKLKQRTAGKKFRSKIADLKAWFPFKLTTPIAEVWASLKRKLRGHFGYYHFNDKWEMLMKYREAARRLAFRWMRRRSHKGGQLGWESYQMYLDRHPLALPGRLKDLIAMGTAK